MPYVALLLFGLQDNCCVTSWPPGSPITGPRRLTSPLQAPLAQKVTHGGKVCWRWCCLPEHGLGKSPWRLARTAPFVNRGAWEDYLCHVRVLDADAKTGEPYGYTAPPVDVFASAVCILIMFFAAPPWRQAGKGAVRRALLDARPDHRTATSNGYRAMGCRPLPGLGRRRACLAPFDSRCEVLPPAVLDLLNQMLITEAERRPVPWHRNLGGGG